MLNGVNAGLFLEQYIALLRPDLDWLFARPRREPFDIHDNNETCYYEDSKVGENLVKQFMPNLSVAANIPRLVNAQIRTTTIRKMKEDPTIEDRTVMSLTGQKKVETLRSYDPKPNNRKRMDMCRAIWATKRTSSTITSPIANADPGPAQNNVETITTADVHAHNNEREGPVAQDLETAPAQNNDETITTAAEVHAGNE